MDLQTGNIIASADIGPGVDHIAFDSEKQVLYSACEGTISITKVSDAGLESLGSVKSPRGAHSIILVPSTHDVWISYADKKHSYFQKFKSYDEPKTGAL